MTINYNNKDFEKLSSILIDLYYTPIELQDEQWKKTYAKVHSDYEKIYRKMYKSAA